MRELHYVLKPSTCVGNSVFLYEGDTLFLVNSAFLEKIGNKPALAVYYHRVGHSVLNHSKKRSLLDEIEADRYAASKIGYKGILQSIYYTSRLSFLTCKQRIPFVIRGIVILLFGLHHVITANKS